MCCSGCAAIPGRPIIRSTELTATNGRSRNSRQFSIKSPLGVPLVLIQEEVRAKMILDLGMFSERKVPRSIPVNHLTEDRTSRRN